MIKILLPYVATLLARTLRIKWYGAHIPERAVIAFWHGDMFAGWWAVRKNCPISLVSRSKDGELLASVLKKWSYQLARGSSRKSGRKALEEAIELVRQGNADQLVITPDGPQGPRHKLKQGAVAAAVELEIPLLYLGISYSRAITLNKSWDKFRIPLPFSKVFIRVRSLPLKGWPEGRESQIDFLSSLDQILEASA